MIADTLLAGAAVALAVLYLLSLWSGVQAERDLDRARAQLDACRTLLEQVDREHAACEDAGERLSGVYLWPVAEGVVMPEGYGPPITEEEVRSLPIFRAGGPRPEVRNIERSE